MPLYLGQIFLHSSLGHLDCFCILAIVNNAVSTRVRVSFGVSVFIFFGYIPRIPKAYGSSILKFLRIFHPVCQNGHTSLQSCQQFTGVIYSLHSCQHLSYLVFLMMTTLTGIWRYHIVVLIYISLMTGHFEHLFMYLWPFIYLLWKNV